MSFFIRYKCKADIHRRGSLGLTQADTNPLHKALTTSTLGLCIAIVSKALHPCSHATRVLLNVVAD